MVGWIGQVLATKIMGSKFEMLLQLLCVCLVRVFLWVICKKVATVIFSTTLRVVSSEYVLKDW